MTCHGRPVKPSSDEYRAGVSASTSVKKYVCAVKSSASPTPWK